MLLSISRRDSHAEYSMASLSEQVGLLEERLADCKHDSIKHSKTLNKKNIYFLGSCTKPPPPNNHRLRTRN